MTENSEVSNIDINTRLYTLSIRLRSNGFSFSRYDILSENSYEYKDYSFHSGASYLQSLENIILNDEIFLQPYKDVNIIIAGNRFTLVPQEFAEDEETLKKFYRFNIESENEKILNNTLIQTSTQIVFGVDKDLHNFLMRTFAGPKFLHSHSILNEYFAPKSRLGNNAKMMCQIRDNKLDIICHKRGKLIFSNGFEFSDINDAAFYLLSCWKNIGYNNILDILQLTGVNEQTQALNEIVSDYLTNIEPVVFPAQVFKLGKASINAPFDLIALPLCEL